MSEYPGKSGPMMDRFRLHHGPLPPFPDADSRLNFSSSVSTCNMQYNFIFHVWRNQPATCSTTLSSMCGEINRQHAVQLYLPCVEKSTGNMQYNFIFHVWRNQPATCSTTLSSMCGEICPLAHHLHETFNTLHDKASTIQ